MHACTKKCTEKALGVNNKNTNSLNQLKQMFDQVNQTVEFRPMLELRLYIRKYNE